MKTLVLAAALVLSACASYTADQEMAITCRAYASTLNILTPFKSSMSATQKATVDSSISVLGPACRARGDERAALDAVRGALRNLLTVEKEVKP